MSVDYTSEETYRLTRIPVQLAHTLNPDAYRSEAFFQLEQEKVFAKSWVCIGYTAQLSEPGDTIVAQVGGQPIFVVKDKAGRLRAFYNVCRHRGSQLVAASCHQKDIVRCPYHAWGYAFDGKLLGTPYFKGLDVPEAEKALYDTSEVKEFRKEDYGLFPVLVDTWGCFVFVNLDPKARALLDWLGDLPGRYARFPLSELKLVGRKTFDVKANWKLIAENFTEYYHLPWVHPELSTVSGVKEHHRYQGPGMYMGMCTSPLTHNPKSPLAAPLPPMPGINEVERNSAYWVLLFPNVALFLFPNHLFTLVLEPDGVGSTRESADLLVHPSALDTPGADRMLEEIFDYWDMVNRQDMLAVERVQSGLRAKAYAGGRMCYHFEEPIHRFQNMVIDHMVGNVRIPPGDA